MIHSSADGAAEIDDEITLSVEIPEGYAVQWQYTPDEGLTVKDIEGATLPEYTFVLTEENIGYLYRVRIYRNGEDADGGVPGSV